MSSKSTLIFVHGAWHSAECWTTVKSALEQQGYSCIAPQLDFCGTEQPAESLASSITQLQTLITAEATQGKNVVLINHSFGGCVGCSAVKGFTAKDSSRLNNASGKVIGIIQLCAFMPPAKVCLYDVLSLSPEEPFHHPGPDGWEAIDNGEPVDKFYNDLPIEVATEWKNKLVKHSSATLSDRESVYPGWADVPVWYLLCTNDQAIKIEAQEAMVTAAKEAGASVTTTRLDSSHSPFLSRVDYTVGFILEGVKSF